MDGCTDIKINGELDKQTDAWTHGQSDMCMDIWTVRKTMNTQTYRQISE
jgi:hypothetical protein